MVSDGICILFQITFYVTTHQGVRTNSFLSFLPWPDPPTGKSPHGKQ